MSNLSGFVKRLRDIMRNDAGINGDAQRIEQIAWLLFLKVYDAKEQDWEWDDEDYQSIIPEPCRWSNWAHDDKSGAAMTGDSLLEFINNTLFPTLKRLSVDASTPIKKAIVQTTFADANNYMKDGVLLRQVINVIDELDLSDYEESHAFGEIYESILKELQSAGSAGEFYTPRAVTDFMAMMIKPRIGEHMADFACGTGGFITSWLKELKKQVKTTEDEADYSNSIYGIEKKQFPYFIETGVKSFTGTAGQQRIHKDYLPMCLLPLPPLAEQKRIAAKIEELLPYIDRYEQAWSRLENFNKRFPDDMKKSILQLAIQGKLVEQRPEEGTAEELYRQIQEEKQRLIKAGKIKKEKPLPGIAEDEKPFEIPESWKWVRFFEVIDVRDGTHDTPKYVSDGVPLVTSKNLLNGKIDFETTKLISNEDAEAINSRSAVDDGDILFAMIGTIGNPVLVKKDRAFCIKNMALFKAISQDLFDMKYLLLFLQNEQAAMKKKATGGVQSFVSLRFLRNYLLPLPPLAEQKRIVARLEELLSLCQKLK